MPRSRVAESPKTSAETRTPSSSQPLRRIVDELRDHQPGGVGLFADDRVDVAVGREADVVELDLVEARARGDLAIETL